MIHALTAKNKIGFINGSIEQPLEKDQPTEYALWNQCNNMILSWLTHSVEPDLAKGVIHAKTAYHVWEDFKDQFSQKNAPAIYQIQKSLASFSQGTMTVSTYFTKLKGLWDELDTYRALPTCNQMKAHDEQREEDRLMQFLMDSSQSTHGVHPQDINSSLELSIDQLQQLAHALSMMTQNQKSPGNSDAYANATGLGYGEDDWLSRDVKFSETIFPFMSAAHPTSTLPYISSDFMDNWQSSPSLPTNIPSSQPQPTEPVTIQESTSSIQSPLAEPTAAEDISPNPTQPLTSLPPAQSAEPISTSSDSIIPSSPPPRQSLRPKQPQAWHKDYILLAQVNPPSTVPSSTPGHEDDQRISSSSQDHKLAGAPSLDPPTRPIAKAHQISNIDLTWTTGVDPSPKTTRSVVSPSPDPPLKCSTSRQSRPHELPEVEAIVGC
ncbi:hypothetical protein RJ639_046286 [Escallonia herrerae]|uniref:Retrotransposon gag domain-containing protein n=1 Tax=Escallonia herrerae TaxID=1293975 RepID=A0AA88W7V7_9ASTE|nr:hypothetical protein RJ639_046286 [Escallonia herrerae]